MKYVNVAIDNKNDNTDNLYTYGSHFDDIQVGSKVTVPFAKGNRVRTGYVFDVLDHLEEEIKGLKYIESVDEEIRLSTEMMDTCRWMRKRYLCRYIDGINCFTPAGSVSKRGKERRPYKDMEGEGRFPPQLTGEQAAAMAIMEPDIKSKQHEIFLIHGITGSGKTELYIRLINSVLEEGRNAIVLVPEISLTTQVIQRFIGRFGPDQIAVLHSRLSLGERYDEWVRIRSGQVRIVIGARSAVFAPLRDIGIIILDEEHEATYKSDMAPKYDTVEVAIKRAKSYDGLVVLGSATPSVSATYRAEQGIYKRVELTERYNQVALPMVEVVDMRQELKAGNKSMFSTALYGQMKTCLEEGQQVILFLNRRGYSTFISCRECGYVMKCPDCGIALTYHKAEQGAVCHYCGKTEPLPTACPDCGSKYIRHFGTGTEKVEEFTAELFPDYPIGRLDLDTIRLKGSVDKIINDFRKGKTKILIGTQLVAKGLDFKQVGLVGIISADVILNIPDYRAAETTFQLVTQAAGRAGRGDKEGKVVIQTYNGEHYSIQAAAQQDYQAFYHTELMVRQSLLYPPFSDIVQVIVAAAKENVCINGAQQVLGALERELGEEFKHQIFPPQPLLINSKKEHFRYGILIKCPKGKRGTCLWAVDKIKRAVNIGKKVPFSVSVDINPY
ncbi:primosomal protein N' [Aminipila butyrica]|uniref:Replication restart protein PriA n=1 Tax=Aminipila butyrica TaxID=433296 RepID=A0A858BYI5_9FIRM|nr:primosomal protein N' [Aminipila butyrica]QIB69960.1 primosomal protein N' [Aminipila butyrica]